MTIRVLDTASEGPHQRDLFTLPSIEWYRIASLKKGSKPESFREGPLCHVSCMSSYTRGSVDIALLHLDPTFLDVRAFALGGGVLYSQLASAMADIPVVTILHGIPTHALFEPEGSLGAKDRIRLQSLLASSFVVTASNHAAMYWGCGVPVSPGLKPEDWPTLPKHPRVIIDGYYDSTLYQVQNKLIVKVKRELRKRDIGACILGIDYRPASHELYRDCLSRALVYLNFSTGPHMPRSLAEAMMAGCCVMTAPLHDAESFIVNGVNGFVVDPRHPDQIAKLVEGLLIKGINTMRIGGFARATAIEQFSFVNYANAWMKVLLGVTNLNQSI